MGQPRANLLLAYFLPLVASGQAQSCKQQRSNNAYHQPANKRPRRLVALACILGFPILKSAHRRQVSLRTHKYIRRVLTTTSALEC